MFDVLDWYYNLAAEATDGRVDALVPLFVILHRSSGAS
jgi:hypothetical protein